MIAFNIPLPFDRHDPDSEFCTMEGVAEIGAAIERAGFAAALVTDHPVPTGRWLDAGGHLAHDPLVMLSLVAAATTKVRLQTGILVLPYRNPFIVARAVATLDRFSGGRVTIGVGAGYLKGEYRALGVDFEQRNELMDEYLRALKLALSGEEFAFEGTGYEAFGNRILPGPIQTPHPPLLVGGNARRAIRRAVELGDGWYPFFTVGGVSTATTRTAEITNEAELAEALAYMHAHCETVGRETPPTVAIGSIVKPGEEWTPQMIVDRAGQFADMGLVAAGMNIAGRTRAEWCDNAEAFGESVIAKLGAA
ncbi:TIGR03619 family F420-dependent LLM class oxidoreductase [Sphingomonas sp. SUN039]|uniref:TIGR03619 family F420-dependent LLM class oxidoreductase n=1 Tax=Sphingomonas sp. SUN039 TaxID=2937787 RepID=UPI0021646E43|nr:TIGR03619 family F420-dependent LLM class oxidoreductase [Sphingomonas sp. SUN039]UVO54247.1 TIGR03619 family F420-dependent LLM class oxidoreductase [Sphingomonas sp. SUN039]